MVFLYLKSQVRMAAEQKRSRWAWKENAAAEQGADKEPCDLVGKQLGEPGRFAYAALCGVSLAYLFPEKEQSSFRKKLVEGLVKWLELSETVLPAMTAFASGLGGEGTETFAEILLKDPVLKNKPVIITQDLLSFSLKDGYYDARTRVLISHISWLLRIPLEELEVLEESLLESLKAQKEEESETAEASRKKKERKKKLKRYLLIGLATVGGGTVIGYKMKKRVGAIEEFEFLPLTEGKQLHITIAITGWLCTGKYGSFTAPWSSMLQSSEQYCLAWESKYLMELGNALDSLLNGLVNIMAQEALKYTILSGIVTALTWPASLLTVANVIDNPWGVCLHRSAEVGKHLAHILLSRQQGMRPVTLVGFSLGARVIYFCLQEMAQEKDSEGIVEDVVLLGAPVEGEAKYWKACAKVVSGRIINGYCRGDWLLSFVYRTSSAKLNVAGLQPVNLDDRRMVNVDLSSIVSGHLDYMKQMDTILKAVGIKTKDCRLEEMGSTSLFSSQGKKRQEPADNETQGENSRVVEDGAIKSDHWSWEPIASDGPCPSGRNSPLTHPKASESPVSSDASRDQSPSNKHVSASSLCCSGSSSHVLGEISCHDPDYSNNNDIKKQAADQSLD
ncbi:transmembrane and coiled-coil domain-containing protein 4 isoform X3 [Alligator sinensis]|uniref:Transmembrane and coiled-coil domain-containing protein 4 isoform X3 n=1 Tax=Alligator sinensis TaxID=38654 RepID=A0A3Q0HA47_ALLSI|nr:transmembrane and coiled-coil domain-containing protein 4 isoform X3 [Alligator sinensis]